MRLLLFIIFISCTISINAQDCPDFDLVFNTQAEIDTYKATYPNCTFFNHSIRIEGEFIHDFSAFDNLNYIGGELYVGNCDTVTHISAFNSLDSIGIRLTFTATDSLISLDAFADLQKTGNGAYINHHEKLESISPMLKLREIGGTYSISYNKKLKALPLVDSLFDITHLAFIHNAVLDEVNGNYVLRQSSPNVSLSNFKVKSYENMEIVAESIKRLSFSRHEELEHIKGVVNAKTITGELWFSHNDKLQNFEGIESITYVGAQIDLWDNDGLKNCKGMENISGPINAIFKINENDSLLNLEGMEKITRIRTNVNIYGNASLESLQGLNNLEQVAKNLNISDNASLSSLGALSNLDTVGRAFIIRNNPLLTSLSGLDQLIYIDHSITIQENGLNDISHIGDMDFSNISKLTITKNSDLSLCNIPSVCNYLAMGLSNEIDSNAIGCFTLNQVLQSCDLPVIDVDMDGFNSDVDCNDFNPAVNPDAEEIPNNAIDENCDGIVLIIDEDMDGFNSSEDCDDDNPDINPDQVEVVYNGIDDDCDPLTLDDDLDEDGFLLAEDCDDNNADVNPGQAEDPYNGIDDDCDPLTLDDDLDEDGFVLAEDCDDEDPGINPDAEEIPNNGIDEDCDGNDLVNSNFGIGEERVRVFPNPVRDRLYVESFSGRYVMRSMEGRVVWKGEIRDGVVELEGLGSGVYWIEFYGEGELVIMRVIKH